MTNWANLKDYINSLPEPSWRDRLRWRLDEISTEIRWLPRRLARSASLVRAYWHTYDFDWVTIAVLMRHQIRRTRHAMANGWDANRENKCRDMLIVETLLTRLIDEPYMDIADQRYPERGARWAKYITDLEQQDMGMLMGKLRHMREWWD